MGEYGRQQVERRFTAARMAADVAEVYASLLSSWGHDSLALESPRSVS
jgi:hypothetical protein